MKGFYGVVIGTCSPPIVPNFQLLEFGLPIFGQIIIIFECFPCNFKVRSTNTLDVLIDLKLVPQLTLTIPTEQKCLNGGKPFRSEHMMLKELVRATRSWPWNPRTCVVFVLQHCPRNARVYWCKAHHRNQRGAMAELDGGNKKTIQSRVWIMLAITLALEICRSYFCRVWL